MALFFWVEQVAEHPDHGVLFSRLHQRGQVLGRGPDVLYVRLLPHLLRLLPGGPSERWC